MKNVFKVMILSAGIVSGVADLHGARHDKKVSQQEVLISAVMDCALQVEQLVMKYPACTDALFSDTDSLNALLDRYVINPYRERLVGVVNSDAFIEELTVIARTLAKKFIVLIP